MNIKCFLGLHDYKVSSEAKAVFDNPSGLHVDHYLFKCSRCGKLKYRYRILEEQT